MIPARISDPSIVAVAPDGWDETTQGHCGDLTVRLQRLNGTVFMRSAWEIEPDEAIHLAAGGKLVLGISAPKHPVVHLEVEPPEEQLTRTTIVREQVDGHGRLTASVETMFPPLPGAKPRRAESARCTVLIGSDGAPRAVARAMEENERLARVNGWIAA